MVSEELHATVYSLVSTMHIFKSPWNSHPSCDYISFSLSLRRPLAWIDDRKSTCKLLLWQKKKNLHMEIRWVFIEAQGC